MPFWTPIIQGGILLLDIFCFGTSYLLYNEQKEVLRNLEKAVKLDVNPNLENYLELHPNKRIEYAGIRGKIYSTVKEPEGVIQDLQDIFEKVKKYGKLILSNPYATPSIETETTNIRYPLTLSSPDNKSLPFTVFIDSVSWGDKFRLRSNAFSEGGPAFYGVRSKQFLPQEDMIITVFGKISRVAPGQIRIQFTGDDAAPFIFTTSTPDELISTQRYYINFSRVILFSFVVLGLAVLGNFGYKEWKKYCRHRQRLEIFEELLPAIVTETNNNPTDTDVNSSLNPDSDLEASPTSNSNDETHTVCTICKTAERNSLFLNCKHLCACQECARKSNGHCPVCSKVSELILPAYIS